MLPGKNILNLAALGTVVALTVWFVLDPYLWLLIAVTVLAVLLGVHLVASIRGGDMPAAISMLQLLRLGRRRVRASSEQRPVDHHRGPGRLLRRLPTSCLRR